MMRKLTLADLTPAMMKTLSEMKSTDEIVAFCASKGFEISEEGAARIMDQFNKVIELAEDDLESVAGGWGVIEAPSS
jgi:spore coat polysaccharide biosynthesis protein SpsF (cytidylyltransferase family)